MTHRPGRCAERRGGGRTPEILPRPSETPGGVTDTAAGPGALGNVFGKQFSTVNSGRSPSLPQRDRWRRSCANKATRRANTTCSFIAPQRPSSQMPPTDPLPPAPTRRPAHTHAGGHCHRAGEGGEARCPGERLRGVRGPHSGSHCGRNGPPAVGQPVRCPEPAANQADQTAWFHRGGKQWRGPISNDAHARPADTPTSAQ